jgi:hypothetical protein
LAIEHIEPRSIPSAEMEIHRMGGTLFRANLTSTARHSLLSPAATTLALRIFPLEARRAQSSDSSSPTNPKAAAPPPTVSEPPRRAPQSLDEVREKVIASAANAGAGSLKEGKGLDFSGPGSSLTDARAAYSQFQDRHADVARRPSSWLDGSRPSLRNLGRGTRNQQGSSTDPSSSPYSFSFDNASSPPPPQLQRADEWTPSFNFDDGYMDKVSSLDKKSPYSPRTGRTVNVNPASDGGTDLPQKLRILNQLLSKNRIPMLRRRQKFHERPGLRTKRLRKSRWKVRFQKSFKGIIQRVQYLTKQGW